MRNLWFIVARTVEDTRRIRGHCVVALALGALAAGHVPTRACASWSVETQLGGAWNAPTRLAVRQAGFADLSHPARWRTNAFEPPLYYLLRVATERDRLGWALDLTHHKLHLANPSNEVSAFSVTHGYNLLTLHRMMRQGALRYALGAGCVFAHPEGEVRGRPIPRAGVLGSGYVLSGPSASLLAAWRPAVRAGPYPVVELRLTAAFARVPIADGHADVPNLALHATAGVGWTRPR